jgi:hypothetical protein
LTRFARGGKILIKALLGDFDEMPYQKNSIDRSKETVSESGSG